MNKGQKILKSAKYNSRQSQLSKRSETVASNIWPNYFSKAKGWMKFLKI